MALHIPEFVSVTIVVQLVLSVLIYFGGKGQHEVDTDGVEIFRIKPSVAWMMTIVSFAISLLLAFAILSSKPTPFDAPVAIGLAQLLFFFFGLYGVYGIRMRIWVDAESIRVKNLLRTHVTYFRDIRSLDDRITGRYRTLDILSLQGKRVIHVTSTFLPDYDDLVQLVRAGMRDHGVGQK
jgi:hypothetical protein